MEREKKNNENLVVILIGVIIILLVFVGLFATGTIKFKMSAISDSKQTNSNEQSDSKQDNSNEQSDSNKQTDSLESTNQNNDTVDSGAFVLNDVNDYLGDWYQEEKYVDVANSNHLNIKNISNNSILFDLYITRTTQINDIAIQIDKGKGTFSKEGSEGDGKIYDGSIEIANNVIRVMFGNQAINFKFHIRNFNIDNFKGEWYSNLESSKIPNSNQVIVKSVDNNKVTMSFYISRTVQTQEFDVYISNGVGIFDITVKDFGDVHGIVSFSKENYIELIIGQTTIRDLQSGSSYTFKYKI